MNESLVCCSRFRLRSRSRRISSLRRRMLNIMHKPPIVKIAISKLQYSNECASLLKSGPLRQRRKCRLGVARQASTRMLTPATISVTTPDASGLISFHFIIIAMPQLTHSVAHPMSFTTAKAKSETPINEFAGAPTPGAGSDGFGNLF